ncbi:MAG: DUF1365 domain-containing protein [Methylotetracoccus sp.]|nr:DUF1365 domain-containing protein [Methylotetracoccus sp.]
MNSCLYRGIVIHRRLQPKAHAFSFRLFMVYLDLAELDQVFAGRWLWSSRRPALAWFRRKDHFGDPHQSLPDAVRDAVEHAIGRRPQGPIRLLTHLRYFGYCFNPISIFYCYGRDGHSLEALVAEVTNTPWGERRLYVLSDPTPQGAPATLRFKKTLHVSPFMPMDLDYLWRSDLPGERLNVHMEVVRGDDKLFDATLALQQEPITSAHLARVLCRHPWMTLKVIAGIHWEALRLWLKGVPLFDHPAEAATPGGSETITRR